MDKLYFLCEFEYGGRGTFYLVAENGIVQNLVNMDGTILEPEFAYGYKLIDPDGWPNLVLPQTL